MGKKSTAPDERAGMGELETELRTRFDVREETFAHGDFRVELILPRAADALIDEAAFDADERLPYWAELWPSARALARHLVENPPPERRVLELGCGVALPSLALRSLGREVLATDYYDDALRFARANAERNGLGPLETAHLDWRSPPEEARYPLVLASDVLYEKRNSEALAELLPRVVAPGGRALVADPGRMYEFDFRNSLYFAGWRAETLTTRRELADVERDIWGTITFFEIRRRTELV
ncbi:MAG TPA: methyltransferase domain-containing protein [Longimicrobium sp.]|nr:methyltransferase domain-containing protein [Longimicrobium sp.]